MGGAGGSLSITAANAQSVLCIDPGHTTGDVAGTTAVSNVADVRMIVPGQYVCIPGANGANKFVARVVAKTQTVSGSGTLTLDTAATSTATGLPIILMEYRQPNDASGGASAVWWYYDGAIALFDPHSAVTRALSVTSGGTIASGYTVTITGFDIYGVPMTETIAVPTSATTANGKKAFKYVASATLNKSTAGTPGSTISIGTTDILGINLKAELWEYMNVFANGLFVSTSTGWTAGVTTTATATTGDVRGTYALQSGATSDGTRRVAMFTSLPARQALGANYDNYVSLFGVAQA